MNRTDTMTAAGLILPFRGRAVRIICGLLLSLSGSMWGQETLPVSPPQPKDAASTLLVRYPRPESANDTRNDYHIALLRLALEATVERHGTFRLEQATKVMNELRLFKLLVAGSDDIDVMVRPTSIEDEKLLTPVRICLDKGLLGYRIALIRKDHQAAFSAIADVAGLRRFPLGQGRDWNDVVVYERNGFTVVTGAIYEGLFEMLAKGRFDWFPRGIEEAYPEYDQRRATYPQLHVEETLLVHYPFVRYAWVANTTKGSELRTRLTEGLEQLVRDGRFDRLFWQYKGAAIRRADLKSRKVLHLTNPFLPATVPFERKELWFDPAAAIPEASIPDGDKLPEDRETPTGNAK